MTPELLRAFARFNAGVNAARIEYARTLAELQLPERGGRAPAVCGTPAGRRRHYYDGTPVCDQCREAYNAARRVRNAKRRAQEGA